MRMQRIDKRNHFPINPPLMENRTYLFYILHYPGDGIPREPETTEILMGRGMHMLWPAYHYLTYYSVICLLEVKKKTKIDMSAKRA
jgi:hypothetical protein